MTATELLAEVRRNQHRFARLSYRYQEARIECAASYARFLHAIRPTGRRPFGRHDPDDTVPPAIPLYTFVRVRGGSLRMVRRHRIAGAASAAPLYCWLETLSEATVVHVEGEVDIATAPRFADAVAAAFLWCPRVIIDLAGVTYIDGSGLGILKRAGEANPARLAVAGPRPHVRRLFDVLELTTVIPVVGSLAAGQAYFHRGN
jgi:anti-anti-sigma factor